MRISRWFEHGSANKPKKPINSDEFVKEMIEKLKNSDLSPEYKQGFNESFGKEVL